jgi:hypothetical protein
VAFAWTPILIGQGFGVAGMKVTPMVLARMTRIPTTCWTTARSLSDYRPLASLPELDSSKPRRPGSGVLARILSGK